jgi:hypothetical protein
MTEDVFGRWIRRFPILKKMRTSWTLSQDIVIATAVLQNMFSLDEDFQADMDQEEDDQVPVDVPVPVEPNERRARLHGQALRDMLKDRMPM